MKNLMQHKGYYGSVEYSDEDGTLFGKVQFIRSLISYEGKDVKTLRADFEAAVDDYLAACKKRGQEPEIPFKGSFNVRVGRTLHRRLALAAVQRGVSLNQLITEALERDTVKP